MTTAALPLPARETPVVTAPAQRFVASAGSEGGLAILAPGFFEYEHDPAGDLGRLVADKVLEHRELGGDHGAHQGIAVGVRAA